VGGGEGVEALGGDEVVGLEERWVRRLHLSGVMRQIGRSIKGSKGARDDRETTGETGEGREVDKEGGRKHEIEQDLELEARRDVERRDRLGQSKRAGGSGRLPRSRGEDVCAVCARLPQDVEPHLSR
jgi:hypothetical protein